MCTVEPLRPVTLVNSYEVACGEPTGSAGAAQGLNQLKKIARWQRQKKRQFQISGVVSLSAFMVLRSVGFLSSLLSLGTFEELCGSCYIK